jgi:hypothetical protein
MNIYQKMLLATAQIEKVAKNLKVEMGRGSYKAVSEGDVLKAVKPIEAELGIYSYPVARNITETATLTTSKEYNGNKTESNQLFMRLETVYRFINVENPEEYIDITTYGDGIDSGDKAPGKAMTYADKYALLKAYKVETGDDPDKEASQELKRVDNAKQIYEVEPRKAELITPEQVGKITRAISDEEVRKIVNYAKTKDPNVKSIADLTKEQATSIMKKRGIE